MKTHIIIVILFSDSFHSLFLPFSLLFPQASGGNTEFSHEYFWTLPTGPLVGSDTQIPFLSTSSPPGFGKPPQKRGYFFSFFFSLLPEPPCCNTIIVCRAVRCKLHEN